MNWLYFIHLALALLQSVSSAAHKAGLGELAAEIDAAIAAVEKVHSEPVTRAQLESMRG